MGNEGHEGWLAAWFVKGIINMAPEQVKTALLANEGKRVRITYDDGAIESADVHGVDDCTNAILDPSGAHAGSLFTPSLVNCTSPVPSDRTLKI